MLPFTVAVNGVVVPNLTLRFRVENGARTGEVELAAKDKLLGWFGLTDNCAIEVDGIPSSLTRLMLLLAKVR